VSLLKYHFDFLIFHANLLFSEDFNNELINDLYETLYKICFDNILFFARPKEELTNYIKYDNIKIWLNFLQINLEIIDIIVRKSNEKDENKINYTYICINCSKKLLGHYKISSSMLICNNCLHVNTSLTYNKNLLPINTEEKKKEVNDVVAFLFASIITGRDNIDEAILYIRMTLICLEYIKLNLKSMRNIIKNLYDCFTEIIYNLKDCNTIFYANNVSQEKLLYFQKYFKKCELAFISLLIEAPQRIE
jgi:hypothetical protein